MKIENIPTLKINQLTQEQYQKAKANGELKDNELYFTPASPSGGDIDVTEYAYSKTETYSRLEVDAKIPSLDGYAKTSDIPDISGKQDKLTFDGTYNASTNKAATVQTVRDEVAKIVADAPEDFNTLKEMSTWIAEHTDSAATMNRAIQKNTQDIANMQEEIVSEKDEFHIVDKDDNIVATIDENGVQTTCVTTKEIIIAKDDSHTTGVIISDVGKSQGNITKPILDFVCENAGEPVILRGISSPLADQDAASKYYVDGKFKNVATPTADGHAANKKYVDDKIYEFSSGDNTVKTAQTANALKSGYSVNNAYGSTISVYFNTGKVYVVCVAYEMYNYNGVFINMGGSQAFMLYSTLNDEGIKCSYSSTASTISFTKGGESISASSCYIREL